MQMVYQKKLEQPNSMKKYGLTYNDLKKREDGWLWAVALYG